jgi:hypothetical protein
MAFNFLTYNVGGLNSWQQEELARIIKKHDITYVVQSSSDLVEWVDIAQSVAGAKTQALNGMSEVTDSGSGLREVKVKDTTSRTNNARRFMRLKLIGPEFPDQG